MYLPGCSADLLMLPGLLLHCSCRPLHPARGHSAHTRISKDLMIHYPTRRVVEQIPQLSDLVLAFHSYSLLWTSPSQGRDAHYWWSLYWYTLEYWKINPSLTSSHSVIWDAFCKILTPAAKLSGECLLSWSTTRLLLLQQWLQGLCQQRGCERWGARRAGLGSWQSGSENGSQALNYSNVSYLLAKADKPWQGKGK